MPVVQTNNSSAFIGGVEIGSRYQFGKLVVGWEGDVTWGDINNTSTLPTAARSPPGLLTRSLSTSINWTGTGPRRSVSPTTTGCSTERPAQRSRASATPRTFTAARHSRVRRHWHRQEPRRLDGRHRPRVGVLAELVGKAEYDYLDFGNRNVAINGSFSASCPSARPAGQQPRQPVQGWSELQVHAELLVRNPRRDALARAPGRWPGALRLTLAKRTIERATISCAARTGWRWPQRFRGRQEIS